VLEQRFGFNQMTPRLWLADLLKSTLLGAVIGLPLAALMLWLMGAAGRCGGCGPGACGWASTCC
jgi:STE24 endopeptidase